MRRIKDVWNRARRFIGKRQCNRGRFIRRRFYIKSRNREGVSLISGDLKDLAIYRTGVLSEIDCIWQKTGQFLHFQILLVKVDLGEHTNILTFLFSEISSRMQRKEALK